jgi:predicted ATPase/DNA-binding winged helix-turn-helix (wHTH) protein
MDNEVFSFGSFQLIPVQRVLLADGKPIGLGSRAFDLLTALVERAGELIPHDELMARAWPATVVEEGSLRVHLAALRKVLGGGAGDSVIVNIPGRGYQFVAPVRRGHAPGAVARLPAVARGNLPAPLSRIIGRDESIASVTRQLAQDRCLTIVGPGGIGKTTVATAVASAIVGSYPDGVWFVGFASLPEPDLVPSAIATALGISLPAENPVSGLTAWLRDKTVLIVLDSCEHVIAAAAEIAETILRAAPQVRILATSREPLRIAGEWRHRLAPLQLPSHTSGYSAEQALRFSAVQLFHDRASATVDELVITDGDVPAVLEICRRLDGMPLALELAAARVEAFGLKGLASLLDDRFAVLTRAPRSALTHHQTLRAMMDWSYDLLPASEQAVLRRLAMFQGDFTIDGAVAIAMDTATAAEARFEAIADLATKSLIGTDISGDITYYRLLDTTRAYAMEKLAASGELRITALRHAEYIRDFLASDDRRLDYARAIDDIRAALAWSFGPEGDIAIAASLASLSSPAWFELALPSECSHWTATALARLDRADRGTRRELVLLASLGPSWMLTKGMTAEVELVLRQAAELAERLDDTDYQVRTQFSLGYFYLRQPDYHSALAVGRRTEALAERITDPLARPAADWLTGMSLYGLADLADARAHLASVVHTDPLVSRRARIIRFGFDQRIYALGTLAMLRWMQGAPDEAIRQSNTAIAEGQELGHPVSLCLGLWTGCQVALWVGDVAVLERSVASLLRHTQRHALENYHAYGLGFAAELSVLRGDLEGGLQQMRAALDMLLRHRHHVRYWAFLPNFARMQAAAGHVADGIDSIDEALERTQRNDHTTYMAESLRVRAELSALRGDVAVADEYLARSLALARRQGAMSWELRAAMSLARLHGDDKPARELVGSLYRRFTEGLETADVRGAKELLEQTA